MNLVLLGIGGLIFFYGMLRQLLPNEKRSERSQDDQIASWLSLPGLLVTLIGICLIFAGLTAK